jgi:hypothetical protein
MRFSSALCSRATSAPWVVHGISRRAWKRANQQVLHRIFPIVYCVLASLVGCVLILLAMQVPFRGGWEGLAGGIIAASGLIGMLAGAHSLTQGWLLPTPVAVGGFLEVASDRLLSLVVPRGKAVPVLLTIAFHLSGVILMTVGLVLTLREAIRQLRNPTDL